MHVILHTCIYMYIHVDVYCTQARQHLLDVHVHVHVPK